MWQLIKCTFGFHRWFYDRTMTIRRCFHCRAEQFWNDWFWRKL